MQNNYGYNNQQGNYNQQGGYNNQQGGYNNQQANGQQKNSGSDNHVKIQLIGRLTKDPESKQVNNSKVASAKIAVNHKGQNADTDFWFIEVWGNEGADSTHNFLVNNCQKGRQVFVEGTPMLKQSKDQNGNFTYYPTVRVQTLVGLSTPSGQGGQQGGNQQYQQQPPSGQYNQPPQQQYQQPPAPQSAPPQAPPAGQPGGFPPNMPNQQQYGAPNQPPMGPPPGAPNGGFPPQGQ